MAACARDPKILLLQDAMVSQWLKAGEQRNAAERAMPFLPGRCKQGTESSLLALLSQAGVNDAGAKATLSKAAVSLLLKARARCASLSRPMTHSTSTRSPPIRACASHRHG